MEEQEKKPATRKKTTTKPTTTKTTRATKQTQSTTTATTKRKLASTTEPKETKEKAVEQVQHKKTTQTPKPSPKRITVKNVETAKKTTEDKIVATNDNKEQEKKLFNFYKFFTIAFACIIGLGILIPSIISIVGTVRFNNITNNYKETLANDNSWVASAFNTSDDAEYLNIGYNYAYITGVRTINHNYNDYMIFDLTINLHYYDGAPLITYRSENYYLAILYKSTFIDDLEVMMRRHLADKNVEGFPIENCQLAVSFDGDYYSSDIENEIATTKEIKERVYRQTKQVVAKYLKYPALATFPDFEEIASSNHGTYTITYIAKNVYMIYCYVNAPNSYGQYSRLYYTCLIESFEYSYYEATTII